MLTIPFNVVATILRQPDDAALYPNKTCHTSFYTSGQAIAQQLLSYIINNDKISHALNQSLLKIIYTQNRQSFTNLPFNASDILIEVFTQKLSSAERNNGLACPPYWHSCGDDVWFNWFKVILQNQLRDILRSSKNQSHQSLDTPMFDDSSMTLLDLIVDELSLVDSIEQSEIEEILQYSKSLQEAFIISMPNIPDLRRLCWILLKSPHLAQESHFLNARTQFHRPAGEAYLLWIDNYDSYMQLQESRDSQQIQCRSFLTWLLFGPEFKDDIEFSDKDRQTFNSARDNLRQNVTRATTDIHLSILPFWIWLSHSDVYQPLWAHFLKQSLSLSNLGAGARAFYNESEVYKKLLELQSKLNGKPVNTQSFSQYTSLACKGFCDLQDRQLPDQSYQTKANKLLKRFKENYLFLPKSIKPLITIDL